MNCEQAREIIDAAAVGAAEGAELRALDAHLAAGCALCAGRRAEAEAVVAAFARTAPVVPLPPGTLDRLLASLPEKGSPVMLPTRSSASPPGRLRVWTLATAVVVAFVGVGITGASLLRAYVLQQELASSHERYDKARADASRSAPIVDAFRTRHAQVIDMAPGEAQSVDAWGRIFWDKHRRRWHLYANGMTRAAEGKVFELWAVADDERAVSLGTFEVDPHGQATFDAELPLEPERVARAVVTEEPAGGSLGPSGATHLLASLR